MSVDIYLIERKRLLPELLEQTWFISVYVNFLISIQFEMRNYCIVYSYESLWKSFSILHLDTIPLITYFYLAASRK